MGLAGILDRLRLRRALYPALALAFFSPYWHLIGTEYRYMMPLVAMTALWAWAYLAFLQSGALWLWAVVLVLGTTTLGIAGSAQFILAAMLLLALFSASLRHGCGAVSIGPLRRYSPLLIAMLLNIPLLMLIASHSLKGGGNNSAWPDITDLLQNQVSTYFGEAKVLDSVTGISYGAWRFVYLGLYGLSLWGAWSWLRRNPRPLAGRFLLAVLLGIPLAAMVYSRLSDNVQGTLRYVAPTSVAVIPALALGWLEAGRFGRRGIAARGLFVLFLLPTFVTETLNQGDGVRDAVKWLSPQRRAEQPLVTLGARMVYQALDFHNFPWREGHYRGIEWADGSAERVAAELRQPFTEGAESGFLFLYRGGSSAHRQIDKALDELRAEGIIVYTREWLFSDSMKIIGLARTEQGRQALETMPEAPFMRFSNDPL